MSDQTVLSQIMLERADADGLPKDHELRTTAISFDEASKGFFGTPQTFTLRQMMSSWAKARKAWSRYSGEPLV